MKKALLIQSLMAVACAAVTRQAPAAPSMAVRLNGCHNRPRPTTTTTHIAQAGWREYEERGEPVRVPVWIAIPHRMSTECRYDKSATDAGCAGCVHGEGRPC